MARRASVGPVERARRSSVVDAGGFNRPDTGDRGRRLDPGRVSDAEVWVAGRVSAEVGSNAPVASGFGTGPARSWTASGASTRASASTCSTSTKAGNVSRISSAISGRRSTYSCRLGRSPRRYRSANSSASSSNRP